jgi:hypothetical protein
MYKRSNYSVVCRANFVIPVKFSATAAQNRQSARLGNQVLAPA